MTMSKINREVILSWSLAVVVFYFGYNEVLYPENWIKLVPSFFGGDNILTYLVVAHGAILIFVGLSLIFNFYRRIAAMLLSLMLVEIIFVLITGGGFSPVAARDIGLLGMALALSFRN